MPRVILTGGPGTGKTTLLRALAAAGHAVVDESARDVIRERRAAGLPPRPEPEAFARAVLERDLQRYAATAEGPGWTFFDRSPLEAAAMLAQAGGGGPAEVEVWRARFDFHPQVFVLPPWPAIYVNDAERDHPFEHCERVHAELVAFYRRLGFDVVTLPPAPVAERARQLLQVLQAAPPPSLLDELRALEAEFHHPGVRCSRERLMQLLHPAFHEVGRSGRRYTRDTVVEFLLAQPAPPPVVPDDHALTPLADDAVLLTYRSVQVEPDGRRVLHTLRASVWVRTAAGWQVRYHQGTPAAETW